MIAVLQKDMPGKFWIMRHTYLNYGVQLNVLKDPWKDIRVRKAVNLYMDRVDASKKLYGGFGFSAGLVNPGSWWFSGDYVNWPGFNPATKKQDQAEALKLIQEAGVKGTAVTITDRNDYTFIAEYNESVLRELGFNPTIKMNEIGPNSAFKSAMLHHTAVSGLSSGGFPGNALASWVSYNPDASNKTGDTKFDEWDRIIQTSTDPAARRKALWDAEKYMVAEMHYAHPWYRGEALVAYRSYLKGTTVPGWAAGYNGDRVFDWIDTAQK
jgi:ABC-type transport system substrate-binding protein